MADRCARCDWTGDLAEHAAEAGHWLCRICEKSLPEDQATWPACERCITTAKELVAGIQAMWLAHEADLGHLRGRPLDSSRSTGGLPLMGGNVLTLLGPGSHGQATRRLTQVEQAKQPRWWVLGRVGPLPASEYWRLERARTGAEHHADNLAKDGTPAAFALIQLEDDFRRCRQEPASPLPRSTKASVVEAAVRYVTTHMRWAGINHYAFDEIHAELRRLHSEMQAALGLSEPREKAEASCFSCDTDLVKQWTDKGQDDHWTCQGCGDTYDEARYLLALRGKLEEEMRSHWVLPEQAVTVSGVKFETLRTWVKRMAVTAACAVEDRRVYVRYGDVVERRSRKDGDDTPQMRDAG